MGKANLQFAFFNYQFTILCLQYLEGRCPQRPMWCVYVLTGKKQADLSGFGRKPVLQRFWGLVFLLGGNVWLEEIQQWMLNL
jgi:hypothetical protein